MVKIHQLPIIARFDALFTKFNNVSTQKFYKLQVFMGISAMFTVQCTPAVEIDLHFSELLWITDFAIIK